MAARIPSLVREGDAVARVGGDQFAVPVQGSAGALVLDAMAHKLLLAFESEQPLGDCATRATVSIGQAVAGRQGDTSCGPSWTWVRAWACTSPRKVSKPRRRSSLCARSGATRCRASSFGRPVDAVPFQALLGRQPAHEEANSPPPGWSRTLNPVLSTA